MRIRHLSVILTAVLGLSLAACGGDDGGGGSAGEASSSAAAGDGVCATTDASGDLLAEICDRGKIVVSTDPKYAPQSSLNVETGEYEGFDIDVATEIANRLGVGIGWEAPKWEVLTAGSWSGRWDMSVGSMTPTNDRQQVLDFTQPYYFTPAVVVVNSANTTINDLTTDLDGKTIGVCSGCSYEQYLDKTLAIDGFTFDFVVDDAVIKGYDTDTTALEDLALGDGTRLDAAMTSVTTAQGFIDTGKPEKIVGDPLFYEPLAVAFDKSSSLDDASLLAAVDQIVADMHTDGTLTKLSEKWYDGIDLTVQQ
ncbi:transporter substrate-binding domain-containing protein [Nocardioides sp.]|uniref:transporter substrate-binding domain-containing protein n=1 Tax=Nocardioides sp. TaxID=35761 RepID=UPI0035296D34